MKWKPNAFQVFIKLNSLIYLYANVANSFRIVGFVNLLYVLNVSSFVLRSNSFMYFSPRTNGRYSVYTTCWNVAIMILLVCSKIKSSFLSSSPPNSLLRKFWITFVFPRPTAILIDQFSYNKCVTDTDSPVMLKKEDCVNCQQSWMLRTPHISSHLNTGKYQGLYSGIPNTSHDTPFHHN